MSKIETSNVKKQRLETWKKKKEKIETDYKFVGGHEGEKGTTAITLELKKDLTPEEAFSTTRAGMQASMGTAGDWGRIQFAQLLTALKIEGVSNEEIANAAHELLLELAPSDPIEGMLCTRLIILQAQANKFLAATNSPYTETVNTNINRASKLTRLYNETLDSLVRYRRKGEQRININHNYVNIKDGQTIVGDVLASGDKEKK